MLPCRALPCPTPHTAGGTPRAWSCSTTRSSPPRARSPESALTRSTLLRRIPRRPGRWSPLCGRWRLCATTTAHRCECFHVTWTCLEPMCLLLAAAAWDMLREASPAQYASPLKVHPTPGPTLDAHVCAITLTGVSLCGRVGQGSCRQDQDHGGGSHPAAHLLLRLTLQLRGRAEDQAGEVK